MKEIFDFLAKCRSKNKHLPCGSWAMASYGGVDYFRYFKIDLSINRHEIEIYIKGCWRSIRKQDITQLNKHNILNSGHVAYCAMNICIKTLEE